jgi:hypothetical protein
MDLALFEVDPSFLMRSENKCAKEEECTPFFTDLFLNMKADDNK